MRMWSSIHAFHTRCFKKDDFVIKSFGVLAGHSLLPDRNRCDLTKLLRACAFQGWLAGCAMSHVCSSQLRYRFKGLQLRSRKHPSRVGPNRGHQCLHQLPMLPRMPPAGVLGAHAQELGAGAGLWNACVLQVTHIIHHPSSAYHRCVAQMEPSGFGSK